MNRPDLEPAGFKPELLEYFTPREVSGINGRVTKERKTGVETLPDRIARSGAENIRLRRAVSALEIIQNSNLRMTQIDGVHFWSTIDPESENIEVTIKPDITEYKPIPRPISADDRKGLVPFFRQNAEDLPGLTQAWFDLSHPLQQRQQAAAEFAARTIVGEAPATYNPLDFKNLQGRIRGFVERLRRYADRSENDSALFAIQTINTRIIEGEAGFIGKDLEAVHYWGYRVRASVQGYLAEYGGLRYKSRLKSLAVLSIAADMMRAEIAYGQLSGTGVVAECFGYAGMEMLQRRAVDKITGGAVTDVLHADTLQPTRRYSIPEFPEIAYMQQRITAAIQHLL